VAFFYVLDLESLQPDFADTGVFRSAQGQSAFCFGLTTNSVSAKSSSAASRQYCKNRPARLTARRDVWESHEALYSKVKNKEVERRAVESWRRTWGDESK